MSPRPTPLRGVLAGASRALLLSSAFVLLDLGLRGVLALLGGARLQASDLSFSGLILALWALPALVLGGLAGALLRPSGPPLGRPALARAAWLLPLGGLALGLFGPSGREDNLSREYEAPPTAAASPEAPDVLLLTLDTVRADHLGCYGYDRARTPVLDALAEEGVLYERAFSASSSTQPSHSSLFTGRFLPGHGVVKNGDFRLAPSMRTLAERFQELGYYTGAVVSSFVLDRQFGLGQGFAWYDDRISEEEPSPLPRPGKDFHRKVARSSLALAGLRAVGLSSWMTESRNENLARDAFQTRQAAEAALAAAPGDRPAFFWVHWWEAHDPYDPPAEWMPEPDPGALSPAVRLPESLTREELARRIAAYDGEIALLDHELGPVLEAWKERARRRGRPWIIAVTADHGEGLYDHGVELHGREVWDSTLHVPLILAGSGLTGGRAVGDPVSNIDLLPTLLELAGGQTEAEMDARSLLPLASERAPAVQTGRVLYHEAWWTRGSRAEQANKAWRKDGWKYLSLVGQEGRPEAGPEEALFQYRGDPYEQTDLLEAEPALVERLRKELASWLAALPPSPAEVLGRSEERAANLAALGYADN